MIKNISIWFLFQLSSVNLATGLLFLHSPLAEAMDSLETSGTVDSLEVEPSKNRDRPSLSDEDVLRSQTADIQSSPSLNTEAQQQTTILSPSAGTLLDNPATAVVVQFPSNTEIELRVNGVVVNQELVGRTEVNPETGIATQSWYGVILPDQENYLSVHSATNGTELTATLVEVRGAPASLSLYVRESEIPADGRSIATVQGQLLDDTGNRSNWNSIVTLRASDGKFIGADYAPDQAGFQIESVGGLFSAKLQAPLKAQPVQIQASTTGDLEAFQRAQFVTPQRSTITAGIVDLRWGANDHNYYSSFRDFLPADAASEDSLDLSTAIFTTGNIGEWLFTGAFNNDRPLNEDCRGQSNIFAQAVDSCDSLYPTYGDDSQRNITAPSKDKLYLRLERTSSAGDGAIDYLMWGDFDLQEFSDSSQLFSSVSRKLHGFKANFQIEDFSLTGFYSNSVEGFQRDTIVPDGTSGFYFLSRRLILPSSEIITVELEELDRPGTVVEQQELYRGIDYDIDYDRGTILLKDALPQTTVNDFGEILVRRIIATYQHKEESTDTNIAGGRLRYSFDRSPESDSWVGGSYIQENRGNRSFELYGTDTQVSLGDFGQVIAEYARSSNRYQTSDSVSGSAYRIELDTELDDWLSGRAYWRSVDSGFSNVATDSFVPGQTRYGASLSAKPGSGTAIRAQFDYENNNGIAPRPTAATELSATGFLDSSGGRVNNSLRTYSLGIGQQLGNSSLELDWIHRDRTDRMTPELLTSSSDQLRTRLTTQIAKNLTLRAQNELTLSSDSDPLYPSRTLFGLDWEFMPGLSLGINQVWYGGGINDRDALTTVDLNGTHKPDADTTINGRFSSIEGQRIGGAIGIERGFNLGPGLRLDLGYERVFNSSNDSVTAAGSVFRQPYAVGNRTAGIGPSAANSYTVGLSYTDNPDLQANARFEHRSSPQGSNTVIDANALGRLSPSLTTLFSYQYARAANQTITGLSGSSNLKLGIAYRDPNEDKFNGLLRYEHRINPASLPTDSAFGSIDTAEHLFAAEALYTPNWQWELYGKYAFRNSQTKIGRPAALGGEFVSDNTLHLAQFRALHRIGSVWDIAAELRWIGGLGGYSETGYSIETGYYLTPDLRMYAGYSGGRAYDSDFGLEQSASGLYLGIAAKINNLFDGFGIKDKAAQSQTSRSSPDSE